MDSFERELESWGVSRRDFLKFCFSFAVMMGISPVQVTSGVAHALEKGKRKPAVIWLEGQDCAGCSVSFTGLMDPPVGSVILDKISLRYHEVLMAGSGHLAEKVYEETLKEGGYILVVEGSIPTQDDRFCMVGGRPFRETVIEAAKKASFVLAVGACASFGGIPRATVTKGVGVREVVKGKTVVNLPTCPVHPEHLIGTVLHILSTGKPPELDDHGRPKQFFGVAVHEHCERKSHFDAGEFLTDWNDPAQKDFCLYERGCKGVDAYSDCPVRKWNGGINYCIACGAPCQGCSEPAFYDGVSPLYAARPEGLSGLFAALGVRDKKS